MKTIAAAMLAFGLFAGAAQARTADSYFTDLNQTAPRSVFTDLQKSAPHGVFDDLQKTAPRATSLDGAPPQQDLVGE